LLVFELMLMFSLFLNALRPLFFQVGVTTR